jgi:flavin-binding protein dodecin
MAIHKVIEIIAQSDKGWEDAARGAVKDAAKTVKNIKSLNVQNMSAVVKGGKITQYRLNAHLTFEVE